MSSFLKTIDVPVIDLPCYPQLPACFCARYARLVARDLFGLCYNPADAWNLRYHNKVVWNMYKNNGWKHFVKPGYLLGLFSESSEYNTDVTGKRDIAGNVKQYTHIALYVGNGVVIHQFDRDVHASDLRRLLKGDFRVVEVLAPSRRKIMSIPQHKKS